MCATEQVTAYNHDRETGGADVLLGAGDNDAVLNTQMLNGGTRDLGHPVPFQRACVA